MPEHAASDNLILGIDLGTTHSLVGVVDSGFPILLADDEGDCLTPSVVHYSAHGTISVGKAAQRRRALEPGRLVSSVKRLIGRRASESDWSPPYDLRELGVSPLEVSAEILRHLRALAEKVMEKTITRAVITVPAFFNDAQRQATKRAGELAGLTVERILAEPTAAALAYGLDRLGEQRKIAVYDLGGGTFDISVLEMRDGVFEVRSTAGDTQLGGDDIDLLLAQHLWSSTEWAATEPFDQLPDELRGRWITAAEQAKRKLSDEASTTVVLPFFSADRSFQGEVSRETLDRLARPLIERTVTHCRRALLDAGLKAEQLDDVVLVGGSTRMPLVRQIVKEAFGRVPNTSQNPDEAVAKGAVIQAGILSGALRQVILLDVTPLSLGIETFGGLMNIIIPRNTTLPCKAGEMFTNAVANQPAMLIRVLQGEREMANDNWELGRIEVPFPPGPKGSARVGVQFSIDANGILQVLARDTAQGVDKILEIHNTAVDVDDARVEAMIAESVDHAFEDMNERIWTEARLKSEELLAAVKEALDLLGDEVDAAAIQAAAKQVQALLHSNIHDAPALKAANATLDTATQDLAVLLVDRAMEQHLL
jgi:molecular chaperone DnaK